jgi:hypothetical protein
MGETELSASPARRWEGRTAATNQGRADSLLIRLYTFQYCFVRLNLTWPGLPI